MKKQTITPLHQREHKPKREPIPRTWFLSHGYTKADTRYTNGYAIWLHPRTNDVYSAYGKLKLDLVPKEKHKKTISHYLRLSLGKGLHILLARLKYLTFKGEIPKNHTIDHIDGNPLNNDIRNLRAIPPAINFRDGGFLRKLRNNGIIVAMYPGIILEGYEGLISPMRELILMMRVYKYLLDNNIDANVYSAIKDVKFDYDMYHQVPSLKVFAQEFVKGLDVWAATTGNVDADGERNSKSAKGAWQNVHYIPIGNSTSNTFQGTFDGNGHTIANISTGSDNLRWTPATRHIPFRTTAS